NQESRLPPGSDFRRWVWITIAPFVTFTEDAINKRKQERELLNKICIVSMLARLRLMPKGCAQ
ncbi:hypothetical protein G7M29_08395, partial [Escherichia coli]|nr:hypothetical protein [Escherichia coli]